MDGPAPTKTKNGLYILIIVVFLLILFMYHGVYKMHFQFNASDVKDYINEEANKYPVEQRPAIYKQINDGVKHILDDRDLTRQVVLQASRNQTPREMELVHASIMQNKAYGYLNI